MEIYCQSFGGKAEVSMSSELALLVTHDFRQLESSVQEQVYQQYYLLVYRMVVFILQDHGAAEDIIQESFLRAIEKAPLLDEPDKLEPWLKKLARNVTLNYLRKLKRNREELNGRAQVAVSETTAAQDEPLRLENEVEAKLMRDAIIRYVNDLMPSYRQIMAMKWLYNMSYKEMAEELELSEGAVRQRLYRARETIRKRLEQEWDYVAREKADE
jgi:RNA polymerase sigma-70 factor (ECF subfamily)